MHKVIFRKTGEFRMKQHFRIIQFTDLHLIGNPLEEFNGISPYLSLQHVLSKIRTDSQKNPPSLMLLTGDLSQDYSLLSYHVVAKMLKMLDCPIGVTLGNHDRLSLFKKTFGPRGKDKFKVFNLGKWQILLLDSHWPRHVSGKLSAKELTFLEKKLAENQKSPTLIFLHHQVLPVGAEWLNKIGLSNSEDFLKVIDKFHNVKAVICGHLHQETIAKRKGIPFLSTPSTSWQFAVNSNKFKLDNLMPGYRWLDLYADGTFKAGVERIEYDSIFVPDLSSKGY